MPVLPVEFRNKLERTIIEARDIAEAGAKAAIEAFAVHHYEPYGHMSPEQRKLRNHLRARARQLGDKQNRKGQLEITHLVRECAYEHWHRMLFARFLAENDLLIEPEMGIAVSLEECEELARD
ncbi:MAG: SAM-dependent DNA methyltransferase, partial [Deltaproteobacteria bacterium]|nr:SAM-dependent DNA methyltransferase [Deltaproteobacteria bacterium]